MYNNTEYVHSAESKWPTSILAATKSKSRHDEKLTINKDWIFKIYSLFCYDFQNDDWNFHKLFKKVMYTSDTNLNILNIFEINRHGKLKISIIRKKFREFHLNHYSHYIIFFFKRLKVEKL